jgi:hypothetical protein
MAFKYATGSKFDDPGKSVSQAAKKVNEAFWQEAHRRALLAMTNRILWGVIGTNGTAATAIEATFKSGCQTGGTGGVGVAKPLGLLINGRAGTTATAGSFWLPAGTQAANTFVKYGIFIGFGTDGTCLAGNESTTSTGAYLPDCPAAYVCVGYMQYATTAGTQWNRGANVVTGQTGSSGTGTFVDLVHYPLYET